MSFIDIALSYLKRGWSLIPIQPRGKRPLIDWKPYQHRKPTEDEIVQLWHRCPTANVGIVTGTVSGIIALDVDPGADLAGKPIPITPTVKTGRGQHFLFKHPGFPVPNAVKIAPGLDIRGESGYIVAPPSLHPSGAHYEWIVSPDEAEPANPPQWLLDFLDCKDSHRDWRVLTKGVTEGLRNNTATTIAGKLLAALKPQDWEPTAWPLLQAWNTQNKPPLSERELRSVFESIAKREASKRPHIVPGSRETLLRFPETAYVGIAEAFSELYAQYVEAPKPFLYVAFLTYLGSLISPKVTLDSEIRPQPRLYTVLLGESSDTRKSSALRHVDEFFTESIEDYPVHYGLGSIEGLAGELGRDEESRELRPLLLHFDELKALVEKCKPEGSIALSMLCTLFERNHFDNTTKTKRIRLRDAHLSLIAACTKETYASMWTSTFIDVGFTNRLFLVQGSSERRFPKPQSIPREERLRLQTQLGELLGAIDASYRAHGEPLRMRLIPEAEKLWENYYFSLEQNVHTRRLDTYGLRLMILLSVSQGEYKTVDVETVKCVIEILEYELAVRRENDPVDAENTIAKLEELIRRQLRIKGPLSPRDLRRFTHAHRYGLWAFNTALRNLQASGEVKFDPKAKMFLPVVGVSPTLSPHLKNAASDDGNRLSGPSLIEREVNYQVELTTLSLTQHGEKGVENSEIPSSGGVATPVATTEGTKMPKVANRSEKGGDSHA